MLLALLGGYGVVANRTCHDYSAGLANVLFLLDAPDDLALAALLMFLPMFLPMFLLPDPLARVKLASQAGQRLLVIAVCLGVVFLAVGPHCRCVCPAEVLQDVIVRHGQLTN